MAIGFPIAPQANLHREFQPTWGQRLHKRDEIAILRPGIVLVVLLLAFLGLQYLLPLGGAIKIGADEDYELAKATLCNHGYRLYTEIWNDQPPLVTFIIAKLAGDASNPILAPRLMTVGFSVVLLTAVFLLVRAVSGLLAATFATALLIGSPGFLELSCSVMQEIPALAPVLACLCLLWTGRRSRYYVTELLAGILFGFGLQMKLIGVAYLPIAGLILWLRGNPPSLAVEGFSREVWGSFFRRSFKSAILFALSVTLTFIALNYATGNSLVLQIQQSWAAHFAQTQSFEYGSPSEHGFDWTVPLKNWDTTLPALLGLCVLLKTVGKSRTAMLPLLWMGMSLIAFGTHKPWWPYYYVHTALPLCWCAGVGFAEAWVSVWTRFAERLADPKIHNKKLSRGRPKTHVRVWAGLPWGALAALATFSLCASTWVGSRIYLEEQAVRRAPKLESALVLKEILRFKPFTRFMFSDRAIYSFHADVPMPPHLGVISLKRFWTGDLTNGKLVAELEAVKPGLILLGKDSQETPYQELLTREYRLVYQDGANRLYAHASISKKPRLQ